MLQVGALLNAVADEAALAAKLEWARFREDGTLRAWRGLRPQGLYRPHRLGRRAEGHTLLMRSLLRWSRRTGCAPQMNFKAKRSGSIAERFGAPSLKAFALDAPVRAEQEVSAGFRSFIFAAASLYRGTRIATHHETTFRLTTFAASLARFRGKRRRPLPLLVLERSSPSPF